MKGCLFRTALLPVAMLFCYPLMSFRAPWPTFVFPAQDAEVAAAIAGIALWLGVLSWLGKRDMEADMAMARNWELKDGARTVVAGVLESEAEPLTAPFSGEECAGYWYEVSHHYRRGHQDTGSWYTDYEGCALVPSVVRGPMRTVAILAPPEKELFLEVSHSELDPEESVKNAEEFLKQTDFGETKTSVVLGDESRTNERVDGPGHFRMDKAIGKPPEDLFKCSLKEKIVRIGDEVLVSGIYSEQGKGLVPEPDDIMHPFHIVSGGLDQLRKKIRSRYITAIVAVIFAVIVGAIYYLAFVPLQIN